MKIALHTKVFAVVEQLVAPYAPEVPLPKPTVPDGVAPPPAGKLRTVAMQLELAPAICEEGEQASKSVLPLSPEEELVEVVLLAGEVIVEDEIVDEDVDVTELPGWGMIPYAPPSAITEPTRRKETRYVQRRDRLSPSRRALSLEMGGASLEILVLTT